MLNLKYFVLLSLFFFKLSFADEHEMMRISDAWISEAPPTVSVLAAYANIQNLSDKANSLTSITSPSFSRIELHLSKEVDGIAKMEKQDALVIQANDSVELSPGNYHLMLFNPEKPLTVGDAAKLTFNFSDGSSQTVDVLVKKRDITKQSHEHSHEGHHHHH